MHVLFCTNPVYPHSCILDLYKLKLLTLIFMCAVHQITMVGGYRLKSVWDFRLTQTFEIQSQTYHLQTSENFAFFYIKEWRVYPKFKIVTNQLTRESYFSTNESSLMSDFFLESINMLTVGGRLKTKVWDLRLTSDVWDAVSKIEIDSHTSEIESQYVWGQT